MQGSSSLSTWEGIMPKTIEEQGGDRGWHFSLLDTPVKYASKMCFHGCWLGPSVLEEGHLLKGWTCPRQDLVGIILPGLGPGDRDGDG